MIKVVADSYIKAEKVEEFILLTKGLVQATRENDSGCIRYELLQDLKNPQHLTILEEWADQDALNRHAASKHFKEAAAKLADLAEKPGEAHFFKTLA